MIIKIISLHWTIRGKKPQITGQNLGRVFNFRSGHFHADTFLMSSEILPNLQLKIWPKQPLGSLQLVIALPRLLHVFPALTNF